MSESNRLKNCKQAPSCKVKEDGKCLEGVELNVCPHFYFEDSESQEKKTSGKAESVSKVELFSGEEMHLQHLQLLTHKYKTRSVVIIGDWKAGKSTLLTSIFDHFQLGYFDKFLFAGSLTQVGFEKRCHPSRVACGGDEPNTERTKLLDFNFLHIGIKRVDSPERDPVHILLSDISGEAFKQARDSSARMQQLALIRSMDFIVIMLDGRRLADRRTREAVLISMKTFIIKAIEEGIFNKNTVIKLVISKWDLLYNEKSFKYDSEVVGYFDDLFKTQLLRIDYHKIVSRTKNIDGNIKSGFGLSELLDEWTGKDHRNVSTSEILISSDRIFDKYKFS